MAKTAKRKTRPGHALNGYKSEDRPLGDRYVSLSHALTRAGHDLTLSEKRLIMACVGKLDSGKKIEVDGRPIVRVSAREYGDTFGLDPSTAYTALRESAAHLFQRYITFFQPVQARNGKKLAETISKIRWIDLCRYAKKEGFVEMRFVPELVPHLTGLKRYFTTYQLKQASALRSVYSWRLLELLMKHKSTGWAQFDIEDFLTSMDAPPAVRRNFFNVRQRIIAPAVKELRDKDGWDIEWKTVHAGRRVRAVRFSFSRNPQERLPLEEVDRLAEVEEFQRRQALLIDPR